MPMLLVHGGCVIDLIADSQLKKCALMASMTHLRNLFPMRNTLTCLKIRLLPGRLRVAKTTDKR